MIHLSLSIPTIVREEFELQTLPFRGAPLSEKTLQTVFGGCGRLGDICRKNSDCCQEY